MAGLGSLALTAEYKDEDSDDGESCDESRIRGTEHRGSNFSVSQDGCCPRCGSRNVIYVILDHLFPMGDMPEILHALLAKGRAVLWSSQEKDGCKAPPTLMCQGFCPSDPLGAGFNINWDKVNLETIFLNTNQASGHEDSQQFKTEFHDGCLEQGSADREDDEEELQEEPDCDENWVVLDEVEDDESNENILKNVEQESSSDVLTQTEQETEDEVSDNDLIKQMLAKEETEFNNEKHVEETRTMICEYPVKKMDDRPTASTAVSVTTEASRNDTVSDLSGSKQHGYPVSSSGACPYCSSTSVKYIVVVDDKTKDSQLPQTLQILLRKGKAFKMAKGPSQPPSFQCQSCSYGFNLNWAKVNLEKIFELDLCAENTTIESTDVNFSRHRSVHGDYYQTTSMSTPYASRDSAVAAETAAMNYGVSLPHSLPPQRVQLFSETPRMNYNPPYHHPHHFRFQHSLHSHRMPHTPAGVTTGFPPPRGLPSEEATLPSVGTYYPRRFSQRGAPFTTLPYTVQTGPPPKFHGSFRPPAPDISLSHGVPPPGLLRPPDFVRSGLPPPQRAHFHSNFPPPARPHHHPPGHVPVHNVRVSGLPPTPGNPPIGVPFPPGVPPPPGVASFPGVSRPPVVASPADPPPPGVIPDCDVPPPPGVVPPPAVPPSPGVSLASDVPPPPGVVPAAGILPPMGVNMAPGIPHPPDVTPSSGVSSHPFNNDPGIPHHPGVIPTPGVSSHPVARHISGGPFPNAHPQAFPPHPHVSFRNAHPTGISSIGFPGNVNPQVNLSLVNQPRHLTVNHASTLGPSSSLHSPFSNSTGTKPDYQQSLTHSWQRADDFEQKNKPPSESAEIDKAAADRFEFVLNQIDNVRSQVSRVEKDSRSLAENIASSCDTVMKPPGDDGLVDQDSQTTGQDDSWKDDYVRNYHEYTQRLVSMSSDSEETEVTRLPSDNQLTKDLEKSHAGSVVSSDSNLNKTENSLKPKSETSSQSSESEYIEQKLTDNNLNKGGTHGTASGFAMQDETSNNNVPSKQKNIHTRQTRKRKTKNAAKFAESNANAAVPEDSFSSSGEKANDNEGESKIYADPISTRAGRRKQCSEEAKEIKADITSELSNAEQNQVDKARPRARRGRPPKVRKLSEETGDSHSGIGSEKEKQLSVEKERSSSAPEVTKRDLQDVYTDNAELVQTDVLTKDPSPEASRLSSGEETQTPTRRATRSQSKKQKGAEIRANPRLLRKK